jgi:heme A synthase
VKIQRWSIRRAGLTVIAVLLGLVFVQIAVGLLTSPI